MEWTRSLCLELIELYRDRPILWNPSHSSYKLTKRKYQVWGEIAAELNCEVDVVKKKIESLLACFRRERAKDGSIFVGGEIYHSKWFAFKPMQFLTEKLTSKNTKSTIKVPDTNTLVKAEKNSETNCENTEYEIEMENTETEDESTVVIVDENTKRDQTTVEDKLQINGFNTKRKMYNSSKMPRLIMKRKIEEEAEDPRVKMAFHGLKNASEKDECDTFGQLVAQKLKKLNQKDRCIVMHDINNIIFKAEMGHCHNWENIKKVKSKRCAL